MIIKKYNNNFEMQWDNFIKNNSANGTIYHTRKFLNYHPKDRFEDRSILIFDNSELNNLICVVPCCKKEDKYFSHSGATYGGPVFSNKSFNVDKVKFIINLIFEYYDNKFECRIANNIYFEKEIFHIYYLLSRKSNMKMELSWYVNINEVNILENIVNKDNKRLLKKIMYDNSYTFDKTNNLNAYNKFYDILKKNLDLNHNTKPTHSFEELMYLKKHLKENLKLFVILKNNDIICGILFIKCTKICWYNLYTSRNINIKNSGIYLIYLMHKISQEAKKENVKYLDYGISTENKGNLLNLGLSKFKQNSFCGESNARYLFLLN
jgi:hypothetical protein